LESAEKNFITLMKKYGGSLQRALDANGRSPLGMGLEFRAPKIIEPLYRHHPIWPRTKHILTYGSHWPLEELPEEQRVADVEEAINFGNHKGATNDPILLCELVEKDVKYGYCIPLPLRKAKQIPQLLFAPMNIQRQNTIDETGKIIDKERLTHDQSYKWSGSGTSVNSRIIKEALMPCMYGTCLKRIINWTVAARRKYPGRRIFASKIDFKSAFRRCNLSAATAIQCCTQLPAMDLILLYLRLTFGGCPCPNEWGAFSEPICDLATAILHDDLWKPAELHSPTQNLVPPPKPMEDNVPFGIGQELIVDIDVNPRGFNDVYIDDMIPLTVDIPGTDNLERCEAAALLAIHATARPNHPDEPIPQEEMEARNKLSAEAGLEETKTILGWLIDFRRLTISLPSNKFIAWTESINKILTRGTSTAKELETTIGRLGHLGAIMPFVYHFLSRLRNLQKKVTNRRTIDIPQDCHDDLNLMLSFLHKAHTGIDMNLIAFRRPTHIYRSDSCPYGLGGYSHEGFAWRFKLPENCRFRTSNNLLEFIASIITPWIDLISKRLRPGDCALSMTDSTTSAGWLKKTNFLEKGSDSIEETIRLKIARQHASHFTNHDIKEYSQWFPGKKNNVADSLSRDFDLDETEISKYLHLHFPSQLPPSFSGCSTTQRNRIVADLIAAATAREGAVTGATHEDQARAQRRWDEYLKSIGLEHDPFLDTFTRCQRNLIICAFATAVREGQFSSDAFETLAAGTVRNTISSVCSTFREQGQPNPSKDEDLQSCFLLQRQFRSYVNDDPKQKQQKAIPLCVIAEIGKRRTTELQRAIGQLTAVAIFFAMRSCKYLKVTQAEKRRTDILRVRNLRFFRDGKLIEHSDPHLEFSDCISITFEMQKKDEKNDTVTQQASGAVSMCPVQMAAAIVRRIRSYKGSDDNTPISAFWRFNRIDHVTSAQVIAAMKDAITAIGEDVLHIKKSEIGTHSIRSGAAMAMFLSNCSVCQIMMIGRWSSDAFLRYIRKQVEQFSHNVSKRMTSQMLHRHIPTYTTPAVSHLDPRQRNNPNNAKTRRNVGGDMTRQARLPPFAIYH